MAKVAIKNMNITSFGGIYIISLWLSYFPIGLGGGFYAYARTKKHRSTSYQHIEPQKDISTYKIFS